MKYILLILLNVFLFGDFGFSQAFNSFNGRNHPEIEWKQTETPHFKIIYGNHLESFIPDAASVAESTYVALSKGLGVYFDRKIKMYLSDEDEIVNGAATPFFNSYTFIWIGLNDAPDFFSGDKKWIRTVLSHELAHLFHFEAIKSNMGIWGLVFGEGMPRDISEGYAQYATEIWNAQRGDRWLRSAIFDDKPSFGDNSPYNGRLLYADGYSKLLFISEQYGDSTIANMFAYRDTLFFGLTIPNVYAGFKKTTGEEWKDFEFRRNKHLNIYYNTIASQMDRTDSLNGKKIEVNQQLIFDAKVDPSGRKMVVSGFKSMEKPVMQTLLLTKDSTGFSKEKVLFQASINADIAWSQNADELLFSMVNRSENGSLVNDLYSFNINNAKWNRLSFGKRLSYPVQISDKLLWAVQNQNGTGNLVQFNLDTKEIKPITHFSGDVQVLHLTADATQSLVAFTKVDEKGNRTIEVWSKENGQIESYTSGETDDRNPRFSPDGKYIAFNSLRDKVPNIFVANRQTGEIQRATFVFTGAELLSWTLADSTGKAQWLVKSTEKKETEFLWFVSDSSRTSKSSVSIPESYASWTTASPKHIIGGPIAPNPSLLSNTKSYSHFANVGHFISLGLPYADDANGDYGLQGVSNWSDPMGKHQFSLLGNLSLTKVDNTYGLFSYRNNVNAFSWNIDAYRFPGAFQFYNDNTLLSILSGFSAGFSKPLDWPYKPYTQSLFRFTVRSFLWEPSTGSIYSNGTDLNFSERWQNDVSASWLYKYSLPYVHNDVHPLKSYGVSVTLKAGIHAENSWFGDYSNDFAIMDFRWFDVRPVIWETTLFTSFRAQVQFRDPLPFEAVQLARYDNFSLPIFEGMPLALWNLQDRVRGYRTFILADQVFFNTIEYRVPVLPTLATTVLGIISFEKTTAALFSDIAFANKVTLGSNNSQLWQWGLGAEIKNKLIFLGLPIIQSAGVAQPYNKLFGNAYDIHYRIQATIPF